MAFDSTIGGSAANSYCTLAYANTHFQNKLFPTKWDGASPSEQERALMTATAWLEELDYFSQPITTTQALKFPAMPHEDDDRTLILDKYDDNDMPVELMDAECELAYYLLELGEQAASATATVSSEPLSSLRIGNSVEAKFGEGNGSSTTSVVAFGSHGLPIHVARLLRGLWLPAVIA